jgi:hypothetical protein
MAPIRSAWSVCSLLEIKQPPKRKGEVAGELSQDAKISHAFDFDRGGAVRNPFSTSSLHYLSSGSPAKNIPISNVLGDSEDAGH